MLPVLLRCSIVVYFYAHDVAVVTCACTDEMEGDLDASLLDVTCDEAVFSDKDGCAASPRDDFDDDDDVDSRGSLSVAATRRSMTAPVGFPGHHFGSGPPLPGIKPESMCLRPGGAGGLSPGCGVGLSPTVGATAAGTCCPAVKSERINGDDSMSNCSVSDQTSKDAAVKDKENNNTSSKVVYLFIYLSCSRIRRAASPPLTQRITTPQIPFGYSGTPNVYPKTALFHLTIFTPI